MDKLLPKLEGVLSNITLGSFKLKSLLSLAQKEETNFEEYENKAWGVEMHQDLYHDYKFSKKVMLENQLFIREIGMNIIDTGIDYFLLHHLSLRLC